MPLDYTQFGGEIPKQHERNLAGGYAAIALDADVSRGTLNSWPNDKLVTDTLKNQHYIMVEDCTVLASERCISVARTTLPCTMYYRTGIAGHPEQADNPNGPWYRLGLPALGRPPRVTYPNGTSQTTDKVIERVYFFTVVDRFGQESQGSTLSAPVLADWDNRALIDSFVIPAGYPIERIRVYSSAPGLQTDETPKADSNSFYRVAELDVGTLAWIHNPITTGYGDVYQNHSWYEPPTDLEQIQHWGTNQLGGLSDGKLLLSQPLAPHAWPVDYMMAFHQPALAWVATKRYGYVMTCGFPAVIDLQHDCQGGKCHAVDPIKEQFPIIGLRSATAHDDSALYASTDGLVMLTGNRARLITSNIFTSEQWRAIHPNTMVGVVHDGFYIGATDNFAFRLRVPDEAYENNATNLLTSLSIRPTAIYRSTTDRLFYADADGIWELGAGMGRRAYVWRGPVETVDARRSLGAMEVIGEGNSEVRIIRRNRVVWSRVVVGRRAFRIPPWVSGDDFQVELRGTGEVSRVKAAGSMSLLGALK